MLTALALGVTAALSLALGLVVWTRAGRAPRARTRWGVRCVGVLLIALLSPWVLPGVAELFDQGEYVCASCGRSVGRIKMLGLTLHSWPGSEARGSGPTSDLFATTFADVVGTAHEHDWITVGCHWVGIYKEACTMIGPCQWYADLPRVPDQACARACVARFLAASPATRRDVLRSYDHSGFEEPDVQAHFEHWHEAWLERHPDWP